MLKLLLLLLAIIAGAALLAFVVKLLQQHVRRRLAGGDEQPEAVPARLPYRKKDWLLTKAERAFYDVLVEVVERRGVPDLPPTRVFAKVRLEDLLWLPKGTDARQSARNRVMSKHVDFVLCSAAELQPLVAVELDDASHMREDRRQRDGFVDRVMSDAGLAMVRVRCAAAYKHGEVAEAICRGWRGSGEGLSRQVRGGG